MASRVAFTADTSRRRGLAGRACCSYVDPNPGQPRTCRAGISRGGADPSRRVRAWRPSATVAVRRNRSLVALGGVLLLVAVLAPASHAERRRQRPTRRPRARLLPLDGGQQQHRATSTTTHGWPPFDAPPGNFGFVNSDLAFTGDTRDRRQLQRLPGLRHLRPDQPDAAFVVRVPWRAGRPVGVRRPAVHVRGGDPGTDRLWHTGLPRTRPSVPTASAACGSSTSATSTTPCSCPACRPAAARTPTRSSPDTRRHRRTSTSTTPAPRGSDRPRSWRAARTPPSPRTR